jgi:ADP-ribosyltransferase exoenzyme
VTNPLVAPAHDSTTWHTGLGLVDDAYQISSGIQNNSWVDGTLGGVGTSLDLLTLAIDPLGSLVAWGVSWLMEHVQPLKDALDKLAGNADEVAAHAATWKNVAEYMGTAHSDYDHRVRSEVSGWLGASGDAYRAQAATHLSVLEGLSAAAGGISYAVQGAGLLVGMVRGIVRDLIAQFVATLAARLPEWLAEEGLTLGLGTPVVIGQVSALVAKWVDKIQGFIRALLNSLRRLQPMLKRLGEIFTELRGLLRKLSREDPTRPSSTVHDPPSLTLTDTDRAALHDYTTNDGYTTMNPFLRDSSSYSDADRLTIQARADRVSDGLAKLPAEPGETYRGVTYSADVLDKYQPGEVVTERAFTSTSKDPDVAQGAFDGNTLMIVNGKNGKDIAPFSKYPEAEILFDKGTAFQVTSKAWNPAINKWVINLDEV